MSEVIKIRDIALEARRQGLMVGFVAGTLFSVGLVILIAVLST